MSNANADLVLRLFNQYGEQLYGFLVSRNRRLDARDIIQNVYLQLLQHPDPAAIENPHAYLFRAASNLAIDESRKENIRSRHADSEAEVEDLALPGPDMETALDSRLRFQDLVAALEELPPLCRHAFILNKFEGMGHGDIARQLGISKKTVQRHILRAFAHCLDRLRP